MQLKKNKVLREGRYGSLGLALNIGWMTKRFYYITQGTIFNTLWLTIMENNLKKTIYMHNWVTFSSVQPLSRVRLFATPWTAACQAPLSITNSRSLPKLMSIQSEMSSHPLSSPSPPTFSPSQHQDLFKWVGSSHQVANILEFQLQHQSYQWTLRTDLL